MSDMLAHPHAHDTWITCAHTHVDTQPLTSVRGEAWNTESFDLTAYLEEVSM